MAKQDKTEKFVKFCQQCGSTNLKPWVDAQIQPQYLCIDCDTIGYPGNAKPAKPGPKAKTKRKVK